MGASAFHVYRLGTVDSTNDWMLAAAREGAGDRIVAVADFQQRGRGRLDRTWEAPAGSSLLCSILLRVALEPHDLHLASVAVALAATEACAAEAGLAVGLKWPNDLVVEDRKLGGVLSETGGHADADGATPIVVGIGVNLRWPGPIGAGRTSVLESSGRDVDRDTILDALLVALEGRDGQLRAETGRIALVEAYREKLVTLGRRVRVALHDRTIEGTACEITDAGLLVVDSAEGRATIASGDVVHLRDSQGGGAGHG